MRVHLRTISGDDPVVDGKSVVLGAMPSNGDVIHVGGNVYHVVSAEHYLTPSVTDDADELDVAHYGMLLHQMEGRRGRETL